MTVFNTFLIFIGISLASNFSSNTYSSEWILRKDKEGIKIYTREAQNTNLKEVKTVLIINTSVSKITAAIVDVENYSKWMDNIINPKILEKINDNDYYLYYELDAPWPTDNRDIVNHTESAPNYIAQKENTVRITLSDGTWELKELSENKIEVTHRLLVSPGGKIPDWVINMFIVNHPYEMHRNLKIMLE